MIKHALVSAVMRVFSWTTPAAAAVLATPLAAVLWYLSPKKRRVTRQNLRAVYPDMDPEQRKRIGRNSLKHYVRGVFEAGILWHWSLDEVYRLFDEAQGLEHLEEAKAAGRGLIVAAPHCGAWEMLNLYLNRECEIATLYKPGRRPDFDEMLLEKRTRGGARMVPATGKGIRLLFKTLKDGGEVALLPDQEPSQGEGHFAPFFGVETLTGVLLPRLARRTGAAVVFGVCARAGGGRYRVHFFKADDSIRDENLRTALTEVNRGIERCIGVDDEQYLWAYKRFRNRPAGEKPFYKR